MNDQVYTGSIDIGHYCNLFLHVRQHALSDRCMCDSTKSSSLLFWHVL